MITGALHLHSTYSDGEFTLAELREAYMAQGLRFACTTDHAEAFDEAAVRAYVAECEMLSDADFLFIPGLEFRCERSTHVLGYGVTTLMQGEDPLKAFRHIAEQHGISVIAHPPDRNFEWIAALPSLPMGLEVWNSKYDGRYAPRPQTFALLERLRQRAPGTIGFYGQDLHWKTQFRQLVVEIDSDVVSRAGILDALRDGRFRGRKGDVVLAAMGMPSAEQLARFGEVNRRGVAVWRLVHGVKHRLGGLARFVPASVKAQLRRIF